MKFRKFFVGILCALALGISFTACSDDDEHVMNDTGSKIELPGRRAYILYEGIFAQGEETNGTGIAFYAPNHDKEYIADIFSFQNGKALGNQAQSIIKKNDFIYVAVSTSSNVIKMNEACVEVGHCDFPKGNDPRYMVEKNGFLYVTHYGGQVSKIDTQSMKVVETLQIPGGKQLEGITEYNNRLYVANSYAPDFTKLKEVFVINPQTMSLENTITVLDSPKLLCVKDNQIYLISLGNFTDVASQLQVIDPRTNTSRAIAPATLMAEGERDQILLVNTETVYDADWNATYKNKFFSYNTKTQQLNEHTFLANAPEELATSNIYMLTVDELTGEIYVGTAAASGEGTIYRFDARGSYKESFEVGGKFPNSMIFVD